MSGQPGGSSRPRPESLQGPERARPRRVGGRGLPPAHCRRRRAAVAAVDRRHDGVVPRNTTSRPNRDHPIARAGGGGADGRF